MINVFVLRLANMLQNETTRQKFVNDSINFLKKFEFDGLDLDFECNKNTISYDITFRNNILI